MTTRWTSAAGSDHVGRHGWAHRTRDGVPKVPYGRRSLAEHHARRLSRVMGWPFWAYACACGAWHVGRTDGRDEPADGV
jgi:hypothetical protein